MARYWREKENGIKYGDTPSPSPSAHAGQLISREHICVSVCSFTFRFVSADEIQEYIAFFERKTHPSSRRPMPDKVDPFYRWHSQRWYERLPMYLQEDAKRETVVKAFQRAIALIERGKL